jgi:hypothetical protein
LLEQGVDKLLGGKKKRSAPARDGEAAPSPGDELIRKGLDKLFGR